MIYEWEPEPGQLITITEGGSAFSVTITVSALEPEEPAEPENGEGGEPPEPEPAIVPATLDITSDPDFPSNVELVIDGTTATISSENPIGFFPYEIDYLLTRYEDSKETVTSWDDIPEEAQAIISFRPDPATTFNFIVTATARDSQDANEESVQYIITVNNNYSIGRDALKQAVEQFG